VTTRVGVTGASGFIGSALLARLQEHGELDVVALTRTIPPALPPGPHRVRWLQGDLGSQHDAAAFVEGLDCVVHLAHTNTPLTSNRDLPSDASLNLTPTLTLLQAIRDAGTGCHVVFASSGGALYRGGADRSPVTEEAEVAPSTSYGIQKRTAEEYLRLGAEEGWLTATALRIGNAYGRLLPPERLQGFLGVAVSQLAAGRPIRIFGDPANVRDYVHLDDVCHALELALARRGGFEVFNIGSGVGISVQELVELLGRLAGMAPPVEHDPPTADTQRLPRWIVLDSSKAARELGWRPTVALEEGVRALWEEAQRA
jgi:UDP-glucose 4-epimerase